LEREGMNVFFQAINSKTGIAELVSLVIKAEILTVEIEMPVMDGYEVIDFVKKTCRICGLLDILPGPV
jgi:CheY-like chemotaxis protein